MKVERHFLVTISQDHGLWPATVNVMRTVLNGSHLFAGRRKQIKSVPMHVLDAARSAWAHGPCHDPFLAGICVALQVMHASGHETDWVQLIRAAGVRQVLHYAKVLDPDEWPLGGFDEWAVRYFPEEMKNAKP